MSRVGPGAGRAVARTSGSGRRARLVCLIASVALGIAYGTARPLAGQYARFAHIGSGDGLADDGVLDITQDRTGFMWFGTINGLNRFDGRNMRVYRFQLDDPHSLPSNRVQVVHVDRAGTLWVGTTSGLSRYEPARDAFTSFLVEDTLQLPNRIGIGSIVDRPAGGLWLGTARGVYRFDPATGRADPLPVPWPGGPSAGAAVLLQDDRGHLWIGSQSRGLADFDPGSGRFRFYANLPGGAGAFPTNDVRDAVQERGGMLWIGTYGAGLVRLDPRTGAFQNYRHDPTRPNSLAWDNIYRLKLDGRGGLWIGTQGRGLAYRDPAGRFYQYVTGPPGSISGTHFSGLFVDRTGTLWAGSHSMGVNRLLRSSDAIRAYLPTAGDPTSLASPGVLGFAEAADGSIWIANGVGGLGRFDPMTGRFSAHTDARRSLNVLAVATDPDGAVWLGTWTKGLGRYDPRTGAFRFYDTRNASIPSDNIFALHVDRSHRLWAGTSDRGLFSFDPATGAVRSYRIAPEGQPQWQIWVIRELSDGRLALGTLANGLVLIDPATGRRTSYVSSAGPSLSSNNVRALLEAEPGVLWVGTDAGLDRLELRTGAIAHFTQADGLPSGIIAGLALDDREQLWVSSANGITRFDPRSHATLAFTLADGLQGREFNPRSYLQARDGTLYFGGNGGFNAIRPALLTVNPYRPPVVITGLRLFNQTIVPGTRDSPLRQAIEVTHQVTLKHDQSVITIEFAALDFNAPERNRYAYRLEGFDRRWTYAGTGRTATFTGLPPGDYVFHVKGSNGDGVWNDAGASLRITILPAYWQTWWFRALAALLLLTALLLTVRTVRARQRHLALMNRRLEEAAERDRERQRYLQGQVLDILSGMRRFATGETGPLPVQGDDAIRELRGGINRILAERRQAEAELRQVQKMDVVGRLAGAVAQDFDNLLTVIQGYTTLALGKLKGGAGRRELEAVRRATERAGTLTRELLAVSREQVTQPRPLSLNAVVRRHSRMLQHAAGPGVDFRLELDEDAGWVYGVPGLLEQVLLNLVANARDAMPHGGTLTITTRPVDAAELRGRAGWSGGPCVALAVSDTGVGIPQEARDHIFEPFFTTKEAAHATGLGLATVYGTVKQGGGLVHVDSVSGQGTTFTLYFRRLAQEDGAPEPQGDAAAGPSPGTRGTILLVEDETAVRDLTARVLHAAGYTVLVAEGAAAALRVADRNGPIDLLLADVALSGMTGRDLVARLTEQNPGVRLLFTCGATPLAAGSGPLAARTAFLQKPFAPADLLRQVDSLLRARSA